MYYLNMLNQYYYFVNIMERTDILLMDKLDNIIIEMLINIKSLNKLKLTYKYYNLFFFF